jgi:hypothetical protein
MSVLIGRRSTPAWLQKFNEILEGGWAWPLSTDFGSDTRRDRCIEPCVANSRDNHDTIRISSPLRDPDKVGPPPHLWLALRRPGQRGPVPLVPDLRTDASRDRLGHTPSTLESSTARPPPYCRQYTEFLARGNEFCIVDRRSKGWHVLKRRLPGKSLETW